MLKLKIRKGDFVIVITGKDKGKSGKVLMVLPKANKAIVAGVNIVKKHTKASATSEGGIVLKELPINISNIAHLDPSTNLPTKVAIKVQNGAKVRIYKRSGEVIPEAGR